MTEQFVDRWSEPGLRRAIELGQYKEVGGPGLAAAIVISLATVVAAGTSWTTWHGYQVAGDYVAGEPGVTDEDLDLADSLMAGFAWGYLVAILIAATLFLVWLRRARLNAEMLSGADHRRARGWVVGAWFCPIVNLWFPFVVVEDIYKASRPDQRRDVSDLRAAPGSGLLGAWWALWLGAFFVDRILGVMYRDDDITVDALRSTAIVETIATGLLAGAAVLIIMIMRRISFWQSPR